MPFLRPVPLFIDGLFSGYTNVASSVSVCVCECVCVLINLIKDTRPTPSDFSSLSSSLFKKDVFVFGRAGSPLLCGLFL